jgi:hypothetical protein
MKRRPGGCQVGPADRPGSPAKWAPLLVAASNRSLRCILTIVSCRFDPRVVVHPTGLYKQRQTSPEAINQSIIS